MTTQVAVPKTVDADLAVEIVDQTESPPRNETVEIVGPYASISDDFRLIVNDCKVPYIQLYKYNNGNLMLKIDGRFAGDFTKEEIMKFGYVLANAMAVSAGFTHHGPDSQPMNRHSCGDKDILR